MRPGVQPNFVSDLRPLPALTKACLDGQPAGAFSGVSKDGEFCWLVKGSLLEVLEVSNCRRIAAWQFGHVLGDDSTVITCVKEFGIGTKLLVGVSNISPVGLLCLFDVVCSKVIKAVEIPNAVTDIEIVTTSTGDQMPSWIFSDHLCYFFGLVAVGTNTGYVYLVGLTCRDQISKYLSTSKTVRFSAEQIAYYVKDKELWNLNITTQVFRPPDDNDDDAYMCIDDNEFYSDEELPSKLHFISPRNRDTENQRFHCMSQGLHLSLTLNESMFTQKGFEYQKPDGIVIKTFQLDAVRVSCLKYVSQAGILVIGYNFGCFQLWKLNVPTLEYSSRIEPDPLPVTHIAYQEPENDPKNFFYIWIGRGPTNTEDIECVSRISMYQLAFNSKTVYGSYGVYYDDLNSVGLRLEHDLGSQLIHNCTNFEGVSRILTCYTLADPYYRVPNQLPQEESFEESSHGPDYSLCVFVWETNDNTASSKVSRHLAIFDINRWYHAQMPSIVRYVSDSVETCSYMCYCSLDGITDKTDSESILAVHVCADRIQKFINNTPVPPEQYFYPASVAFDVKLVLESGIVEARYLGSQRQVLASIEAVGPSCLLQPQDLFNMCLHVGLLPRPLEMASVNPNMVHQREMLLSLALEYHLIKFLNNCISQWTTGEYEHHGCTLKFLFNWASESVASIKHKIDTVCECLYNWSGLNLDKRAIQTLLQCSQRLVHLVSIFKTLQAKSGAITDQGEIELQDKMVVTSLICQHLDVVLWFVRAGLLPEFDDTETSMNGSYCYPSASLVTAYKTRRSELQAIHSDIGETDLLLIDGLVGHIDISNIWNRDGGNGLYPPPSIYAVLSTYMLEHCDMLSKHCLVLYLLLDLVSVESDTSGFSDKVHKFACRFRLPLTLVKLIQAFWLIDHKDFEEALNLMLDPLVMAEFSSWQHHRVIKSLLYQGDFKLSLRYMSSLQPALTTPEDVKLKLTVLLANGLTSEALEYQRVCRDKNNATDLLTHLFLGCQQTKTVDRLLQLPLTGQEETILINYLLESTEPYSQELLIMHYLQRARFVEAIQLNEKLKNTVLIDSNAKARERAAARNSIIDSYTKILPLVQRRLLFEQIHMPKRNIPWRQEVHRPTPLSTKITTSNAKVMSQSAFIMTLMEKVDEIEQKDKDQCVGEMLNRSIGPFIGTPVTHGKELKRDIPATIYPQVVDGFKTAGLLSKYKSLTMFQDTDTPTGTDNRKSRIFSASCLSLLQTPTIKKCTPKKSSSSTGNVITPQSILKVRNLITTSPHSGSTTPNSQELDTSGRKLRRIFGYSAGKARSGIPRHVSSDISLTSHHCSPKSVSFLDQSLPDNSLLVTTPKVAQISQPSTPKSVKFADTSCTMASMKLQELTTPKQSRLTRTSGSSMLQHSLVTHQITKLIRDTSSTAESVEKSLKLASPLEQLAVTPDSSTETTPTKREDNLVLTMEESDENLTDDEEMEQMEYNTPPGSLPVSSFDIASLDSQQKSPVKSSSSSSSLLTKFPSSPTVKISKSPVSLFASLKAPEDVDIEVLNESRLKENNAQAFDIDLTDDNDIDMEHDESAMDVTDVKAQVEVVNKSKDTISHGEVGKELIWNQTETVTSNKEIQKTAVSKGATGSPVKNEVIEGTFTMPPELVRHLEPPTSPFKNTDLLQSKLTRKSMTPPSERLGDIAQRIKEMQTTPGRENVANVDWFSAKFLDNILYNIDSRFSDSPVVAANRNESNPNSNLEMIKQSAVSKTRKKFIIEMTNEELSSNKIRPVATVKQECVPVKQEMESESDKTLRPEVGTVTPSHKTRRVSKRYDALLSDQQQSLTPTRSSTRLRQIKIKKEQTPPREIQQNTEASSKRISKRIVSESSSVGYENFVEIQAVSPTKFTPNAKKVVQESLLQISKEMRLKGDFPREELTKIKEKKSESHGETSLRSSKQKDVTPTKLTEMRDNTISDENVPVTPTRSLRKKTNANMSPSRESATKTTPTRIKKKVAKNEIIDKSNNNVEVTEIVHHADDLLVRKTPIRGRSKKNQSFTEIVETVIPEKCSHKGAHVSSQDILGISDISMNFEENRQLEGMSSRRQSRINKQGICLPEGRQNTSKRQSLAHSKNIDSDKQEVLETNNEHIALTTKKSTHKLSVRHANKNIADNVEESNVTAEVQILTSGRRRGAGRSKIVLENVHKLEKKNDIETPARELGYSSPRKILKQEQSPVRGAAVATAVKELSPTRTPTRRTRSMKTEVSPIEPDPKSVTPSRKGKSKKVKLEDEEKIGKDKNYVNTLSKRRKKLDGTNADNDETDTSTIGDDAEMEKEYRIQAEPVPGVFEIQHVQSMSFKFSDPMHVDDAEESGFPKPFTPVKSFIFSPPIIQTHSVSKQKQKGKQDRVSILLPKEDLITQSTNDETIISSGAKSKRRTRKLYAEMDEIVLISPFPQGPSDSGEEGRLLLTGSTHASSRRVQTRKHGPKIDLASLGQKKRTKFRMGPLGKKSHQ